MSERIQATEESGVQNEWYEAARDMKRADLHAFVDRLLDGYQHDYGTCVHSAVAAAVATMNVFASELGITGFQAGGIALYTYGKFLSIDGPYAVRQFNDMLYPQYHDKFTTISKETWDWLREQATERLAKGNETKTYTNEDGETITYTDAHPNVWAHWQSIARGVVPFGYRVED